MPIPHKWHFFAKNLAQLINLLYFEGTDTALPSHLEGPVAVSCN